MYAQFPRATRENEPVEWSYHTHPALFLGLAAGIGLAFGVMKARRSRRSAHSSTSGLMAEPTKPRLRERSAKVSQLVTSWQDISDALLGVAIARAVEAIGNHVPGFKVQYDRRHAMRESFHSTEVDTSGR
jgi:hypothetical protein